MTTRTYTAAAPALAQRSSVAIEVADPATTYQLVVGAADLTHTVSAPGAATTTATAEALAGAWNTDGHDYTAGIAATSVGSTVTLQGPADFPFSVVSSVAGGVGQIGAVTLEQASDGPSNFSSAANFSGNVFPSDSDDVVIEKLATPILWGLSHPILDLGIFAVRASYTGAIGLRRARYARDATGRAFGTADEYRGHRLILGAERIEVGEQAGAAASSGPWRFNVDNRRTTGSSFVVHSLTAQPDAGELVVNYLVNDPAATIELRSIARGIALGAGDPADVGACASVTITDRTTAGQCLIGAGMDVAALVSQGSLVRWAGPAVGAPWTPTIDVSGVGRVFLERLIRPTTTTLGAGGVVVFNTYAASDGSAPNDEIANVIDWQGGTADFSHSTAARRVQSLQLGLGSLKPGPGLAWDNVTISGISTLTGHA